MGPGCLRELNDRLTPEPHEDPPTVSAPAPSSAPEAVPAARPPAYATPAEAGACCRVHPRTLRRAVPAARPPAYATPAEAGAYCRVHPRTLRRAVAAGQLRALRIGARVRFAYDELDRYMAARGGS